MLQAGAGGVRAVKQLYGIFVLLALAACAKEQQPLPPPPAPNLCIHYSPWVMSIAAAAVESIENLRKHAGNQAAHYDKCIANHPALDPKRSGGPR